MPEEIEEDEKEAKSLLFITRRQPGTKRSSFRSSRYVCTRTMAIAVYTACGSCRHALASFEELLYLSPVAAVAATAAKNTYTL